MIRRILPALLLGLTAALSPLAMAQDSGGTDGTDGTDGSDGSDETFDEGTTVETYDEEEQSNCSVVAGSAALSLTGLAGLVVVGRRRS